MSDPLPEAMVHRYDEIFVKMRKNREYLISPEVYGQFLGAFDDRSPIHVDEVYAKSCGFSGKVMHGMLLNGFLSHFIGMYFPGKLSLLLGADIKFAHPCHLGDRIRLEATVSHKMDARQIVVLEIMFQNLTRDVLAARGRAQVMMREPV